MSSCCPVACLTRPKTMFAAIGAAYVAVNSIRLLAFLYGRTGTSTVGLKKYKKLPSGATPWAIVTGASEGIGKQFAVELGKSGFNVVIMARTQSKLEVVAAECKAAGAKEVLVIPFDFSTASVEDYHTTLKAQLQKADILDNVTVLVNNVGVANEWVQAAELESAELDARMIKVNCESQVQMTKLLLPTLKKNNVGGIIGLSSFSAETCPPYLACYAATKSFNRAFALAIHNELRHTKVDCLAVKPSFVCTPMSGMTRVTFSQVAAEPTVKYALNQLPGAKSLLGGAETSGHLNHNIISGFMSRVPVFLSKKWISDMLEAGAKRSAKKKAAKEAAAASKKAE